MGCFKAVKEHSSSSNYWILIGIELSIQFLTFTPTFTGYLFLVNTVSLMTEESMLICLQYAKVFVISLNIPIHLFTSEWFFSLTPRFLYPVMCTVKATLFFTYGWIMTEESLSANLKINIGFLIYILLMVIFTRDFSWDKRQIVPELSKKYEISLGVFNSTAALMLQTANCIQVFVVGYLYTVWTVETSTFYICCGFAAGQLPLAVIMFLALKDVEGAKPKKGKAGIIEFTKGQFRKLQECKVKDLAIILILMTLLLHHFTSSTIYLYFYSEGLTEEELSFLVSSLRAMNAFSAILNILKYRLDWEKLLVPVLFGTTLVAIVNCATLAGCWSATIGVSYLDGVFEPPPLETPSIWTSVFLIWFVLTQPFIGLAFPMALEYIQIHTLPAERGAVAGVTQLLMSSINLFHGIFNLLLPYSGLIYLSYFVLDFGCCVWMLCLSISFRRYLSACLQERDDEEPLMSQS